MSNSRRTKGSRPPLPRCGSCGRSVPKSMDRQVLPTGVLVCTRCIGLGVLSARLGCGCLGVPGMDVMAAATPALSRCSRHSGELYGG